MSVANIDPSQVNSSIANYGEGINASISALLNGVNSAGGTVDAILSQALKIKNTVDQLGGHSINTTAQQQATNAAGLPFPINEQTKNLLVVAGVLAAGVGIIYFVKG